MHRLAGDPAGGAQAAVRRGQEHAVTWRHQELSQTLNEWAERFAKKFLAPVLKLGRDGPLPSPVIGFETFDHRVYAYYHLGKNAVELEDEIILNEKHLSRSLYAVLEIVLHEQINAGKLIGREEDQLPHLRIT